jgi:hypothetical protein
MKLTYRQLLYRPNADGRCGEVVDEAWESQRVKLPTGVSSKTTHFRPEARRVVLAKDPDATSLSSAEWPLWVVATVFYTMLELFEEIISLAFGPHCAVSHCPGGCNAGSSRWSCV